MDIQLEQINPALAHKYLQMNSSNRPLSESNVEKLVGALKRGEWALNGDTIRFSDKGVLIDGQHRLTAIVRAGVSVPMLVIRGLPSSVFDTIDLNKPRSAADTLAVLGVKCSQAVAAGLRWIDAISNHDGKPRTVSHQQIEKLLEQYPRATHWASFCRARKGIASLAPSGPFVAVLTLAELKWGALDVTQFAERLADGADLAPGSPILTLRTRLLDARLDKQVRVTDTVKAAWFVHAMNAHHEKRLLKIMRHRLGDPFPKLVD